MKKIIVLLMATIMVLSMLVACSSPALSETDVAKAKIEEMLTALKAGEMEKVGEMMGENISGDEDDAQGKEMLKALLADMKWENISGEIVDGKGEFLYKITSKNMGDMFEPLMTASTSGEVDPEDEEAMNKLVLEVIGKLEPKEKEVTFKVTKDGDNIKFENSEEALMALFGMSF